MQRSMRKVFALNPNHAKAVRTYLNRMELLVGHKVKTEMVNLQVVARVGEIETLIDQREIRNDVVQDGVIERRPVGE